VERPSWRDDPLPSVAAPRCDQCAASTFRGEALDDQTKIVAVAVAMAEKLPGGQGCEGQSRPKLEVFGDLVIRQVCRKRRALVSKHGDARSVDVAPEIVRLKDCSDRVL
jgi:hypothetical protein